MITLKFTKKRFARHCTFFSNPGTVIIDNSEHLGILLRWIYHSVILHKSRFYYYGMRFETVIKLSTASAKVVWEGFIAAEQPRQKAAVIGFI